jgi:hypothetical protein
LPHPRFDFTKHRQAGSQTQAGKASLEDSLANDGVSINRQANMIGIQKVGGHQFNSMSRRMRSLA